MFGRPEFMGGLGGSGLPGLLGKPGGLLTCCPGCLCEDGGGMFCLLGR